MSFVNVCICNSESACSHRRNGFDSKFAMNLKHWEFNPCCGASFGHLVCVFDCKGCVSEWEIEFD